MLSAIHHVEPDAPPHVMPSLLLDVRYVESPDVRLHIRGITTAHPTCMQDDAPGFLMTCEVMPQYSNACIFRLLRRLSSRCQMLGPSCAALLLLQCIANFNVHSD